jgi:hypothetical protein
MTNILPADYSNDVSLPQVLGKTSAGGSVLELQYDDNVTQLLLDGDVAATARVRVSGYGVTPLSATDISFVYKPLDNSEANYIKVDILGEPELQPDGSYIVTTNIPPLLNQVNGHLIATSTDGSYSDGLPIAQAPYPSIPKELENDGASREIILDYENLLDVLAPPNTRSTSGTVQSNFAKKGLNALENKDDKKRKNAVQGAVQQAVSRIRGLSEVIAINHLADEVVKLQTWSNTIMLLDIMSADAGDLASDVTNLIEYTAGITQDLIKLTKILEEYGINLKGTTSTQNSAVVNQAAQAFRYTSNSVYDIESPTTLLNTEYLIQQSSKATFRQTGVDQLSCFDSWHRAEDTITRQAKTQYNYASEKIFSGAKTHVGTYNTGSDYYNETYKVQTGTGIDNTSFLVNALSNIDLFSSTGDFLVRAMRNIIHRATSFIVKAGSSIFLQSEDTVAIEAKDGDLHLISRGGRIVLDADNIIFRTDNPVEFYKGKGPEYELATPEYVPLPVKRPDLMRLPHLSLKDANFPDELGLLNPSAYPSYTVKGEYLTAPTQDSVLIPQELLEYPKAPLGATVPQPNNGVVSSPVYPSA